MSNELRELIDISTPMGEFISKMLETFEAKKLELNVGIIPNEGIQEDLRISCKEFWISGELEGKRVDDLYFDFSYYFPKGGGDILWAIYMEAKKHWKLPSKYHLYLNDLKKIGDPVKYAKKILADLAKAKKIRKKIKQEYDKNIRPIVNQLMKEIATM